jgi:predicted outer membrane lipoprotein
VVVMPALWWPLLAAFGAIAALILALVRKRDRYEVPVEYVELAIPRAVAVPTAWRRRHW